MLCSKMSQPYSDNKHSAGYDAYQGHGIGPGLYMAATGPVVPLLQEAGGGGCGCGGGGCGCGGGGCGCGGGGCGCGGGGCGCGGGGCGCGGGGDETLVIGVLVEGGDGGSADLDTHMLHLHHARERGM